jgi:peptidoglycan/LPS O-acetylase OafA/YrhL
MVLGDLDFRNNSIGFMRFFLAATVIWSHAYYLGGFNHEPIAQLSHGTTNAGFMAVGGFFVLSGFLITRSYESVENVGRFLWHRFLRIFPAFWICLFGTAFIFAPLVFSYERGSLAGFAADASPWSYIANNVFLAIRQNSIDGLLAHLPSPAGVNDSLWTLQYEFFCYLAIAGFGVAGMLKRKPELIVACALFIYFFNAIAAWRFGSSGATDNFFSLYFFFALGSCAYLFRDRLPMRGWIAAVAALILVTSLLTPYYAFIGPVCLSYLALFAAMKLPFRNFDRRMDLSYGIYIYAYPVQQLLALYGLYRLGFAPYLACTLAITVALAACSWFAIEKPSLSLKNATLALGRA